MKLDGKIYLILNLLFANIISCQNYQNSLPNYESFNLYKGKPLSNKFSNIESVKVIYDIKNKKIYYFNSKSIRLHYDFVTSYLGYTKDLNEFNDINYSNSEKNREFLLGNLNHIKNTDKWILELAASDYMPLQLIDKFYTLVAETSFVKKKLKFYLNSRDKITLYENNNLKIPCVKSDYIFNEIKYQQVVAGSNIGILKKYSLKELETKYPNVNEIIILDGTPENLPNVKGIIVNELQTPLSHLVILGKNRKIPIMAETSILKNEKINSLINKKVEIKILTDTFYINETNKKIVEKRLEKKKLLLANNNIKDIVDLSEIPKNGINYIGAKAQNLAYIISISKETHFKTPENAYAIPFYYYNTHIKKKEISQLIKELLNNEKKDSIVWIKKQLKKIREAIKKESIDSSLISNLNQKLKSQTEFKNFRFRSSTNAEDIEGFNGAGLYESKTGIIGDSIKTFEKAIKQVWASVWNESSYFERELFGIDQHNIAMGVLVHRAFPDEIANGVIITKNIFRDNFSGITVNVQKGENSVVKPKKGEICEQFTVYDFDISDTENKDFDVDYVSNSNLNNNIPILSSKEINTIYRVSKKIENKMYRLWKKTAFHPVDIEFKIVGDKRELYIKQVRPFND